MGIWMLSRLLSYCIVAEFFDYVAERLSAGDNVRLRLKGNSMFPLLRNNRDIVVLAPCACDALAPMDVVLFRYRDDYVLHRIVRRNGDRLLMQGDGVYASFEQCMVGDVVGRVVAVCRQSGRVDSVDRWRWRATSRLWRMVEPLRRCVLKFLYHYFDVSKI